MEKVEAVPAAAAVSCALASMQIFFLRGGLYLHSPKRWDSQEDLRPIVEATSEELHRDMKQAWSRTLFTEHEQTFSPNIGLN